MTGARESRRHGDLPRLPVGPPGLPGAGGRPPGRLRRLSRCVAVGAEAEAGQGFRVLFTLAVPVRRTGGASGGAEGTAQPAPPERRRKGKTEAQKRRGD